MSDAKRTEFGQSSSMAPSKAPPPMMSAIRRAAAARESARSRRGHDHGEATEKEPQQADGHGPPRQPTGPVRKHGEPVRFSLREHTVLYEKENVTYLPSGDPFEKHVHKKE